MKHKDAQKDIPETITRNPFKYDKIVFHGKIGEVYETKDWDNINFVNVNRKVNLNKKEYRAIAAQIAEERGMFHGIGQMDKYGNLEDGQDRAVMCKNIDVPFRFQLTEKATLESITHVNNTQCRWTVMTSCYSQVDANNAHYKKYLDFRTKTPQIDLHNVWKAFLSQKTDNPGWHKGLYKAKSRKLANRLANVFIPTLEFLNGRRQEFAFALMAAVLSKGSRFNNHRFQNGLKSYAIMLQAKKDKKRFVLCDGYNSIVLPQVKKECHNLINDIYNYGKTKQIILLPV